MPPSGHDHLRFCLIDCHYPVHVWHIWMPALGDQSPPYNDLAEYVPAPLPPELAQSIAAFLHTLHPPIVTGADHAH